MHDTAPLILERVDRFLGEYLPRGLVRARSTAAVSAWTVPGGAEVGEPIGFPDMLASAVFEPVGGGHRWGAPWDTCWFAVSGAVPADWHGRGRTELHIDLGFSTAKPGFQCEGLVRTPEGRAIKGLEPRNHHVPLGADSEEFLFYVEASANPDLSGGDDFRGPTAFAPNPLGNKATAGHEPRYRLGHVELRLIDEEVEQLQGELAVLRGLAAELQAHDPRRAAIVAGLEQACYLLDPDRPADTAPVARERLAPLLASPACASAHRIVATGHAHIDSAWLWPARETVRKVTRTFANVLDLMDRDDDLVFTCSSAQHLDWVRRSDPELFGRIRRRVAEGRFVPVGNMWVESDVNMPSGESLARQLLYGTRFFEREFGVRSEVGWLPDSFGYPASLPQILKRGGLRWFFTQKMCWNDTEQMPHHTFHWEGLDGTRMLTHFPPNNTYSGDMRPTELARSVRNFTDHAGASVSLMPFGYGDGGGGPTREMMRDARLQADLEGSARLRFGAPADFFREAEAGYREPPVWSGEMYLQFHRGIFTSQARTKQGNRRNEALLVEAEAWCATAAVLTGAPYPYDLLDELWQQILLLQFHDILPGSSIAWVHREAEATHVDVTARLDALIADALAAFGSGGEEMVANPAAGPVAGIAGWAIGRPQPGAAVSITRDTDGFLLESAELAVRVAPDGTVTSIFSVPHGRELVADGRAANLLQLHVDAPARWDAWELDRGYRLATTQLTDGEARLGDDCVIVERRIGESTILQRLRLDDSGSALRITTEVDWRERHRLLKLAFPLDVHASDAVYETSFGHVRRPIHTNTASDAARFEVCAHRWVQVGEPGFGVVVANDSTYGHDVTREIVGGHVTTVVRQSLLRAPTFPDPDADQGRHTFETLLAPAEGVIEAGRYGAAVSAVPRPVSAAEPVGPIVSLAPGTTAALSAVKLAADRSGDLIVRLYEQAGARTTAELLVAVPITSARRADLVETPSDTLPDDGGRIRLTLRPFEIVTLRLTPGGNR